MKLQDVQRAAVQLFAERGFAATGIRDIGREVNLNSATLYHYTGSKEDLLVTIMRSALQELLDVGRVATNISSDPVLQIGYLVATHVCVTAYNPLTSKVIDHELRSLSPENYRKLTSIRDSYEALWTAAFNRGIEQGVFTGPDYKISRLAMLEMCNGVANWFKHHGELSVREIQHHFVDLAGRMLGIGNLSAQLDWSQLGEVRFPVEPPTSTKVYEEL